MTDGSGNDHGEYKPQKPTVWANMLGKWAFSYFLKLFLGKIKKSREKFRVSLEQQEKEISSWKCYHWKKS
ncbi:hypothetical protein DQQ01_04585 [Blautia argi]|uniref:Uncharacterized protein n=1 Tax=Blautia argi TaxID=1912897 RepID=A0A2Z4U964_9FIRM|nr:hypothetical protein DQQ01_04585 [Blautia argi]